MKKHYRIQIIVKESASQKWSENWSHILTAPVDEADDLIKVESVGAHWPQRFLFYFYCHLICYL